MAREKVRRHNPGPIGERVARLEGKVSVLTKVNCAELCILVTILVAMLIRS